MKFTKNILLTISICFVLCACSNDENNSQNDPTPQDLEYREFIDVSYGNDPEQKYDIFLPDNRTMDTKVVVLVHGGGWVAGDKSDMDAIRIFLQQSFPELAIVNINYRLADENNQPYPMQIDDITSVVNHLKSNSNDYVISDDYGFIGTSAGAHLSMLWSYAFDASNDVDMVCSIVGPTNLADSAYLNNTNPELQDMLDLYGIEPTIDYLQEVSPYHQVTASAPPTILFYGGQDPLVPTSQGTDMRDKLEDLNVVHQFTLYENEGHGWTGANLFDTMDKLSGFINTHL